MNEKELQNLAKKVTEKLISEGITLAVAESCTGGWLSKILTDISGISAIYKGGACTYSNDIKEKILGVSSETLREFGAVSEQTASEMACGIRRAFDSDIGIGITGIAGPSSDNTLKPVGLIYVAISFGSKTIVKELRNCFSESIRTNNRLSAVETALKLLGDI